MREAKDRLRAQMRAVRAGMTPEGLRDAGEAVAARLAALPELAGDGPVMCYLSVRRELPTGAVLSALRARGVVLAVPRVIDATRMEARLWVEPLVPGVLGIPTSDGPPVHGATAAICPGLAFDPTGARLGYGAGYYDRWLAENPSAVPIGVCVDEALLDEVPCGLHDHRMALVVTPTRTLRIR